MPLADATNGVANVAATASARIVFFMRLGPVTVAQPFPCMFRARSEDRF